MASPVVDLILGDVLMHDHSESDLGAVLDSRYLNESSNLSDLDDVSTARTNLGLVAGGTGDIWVEKAGDRMTGGLEIASPDTETRFQIFFADGVTNILEVDERGRVGINVSPTATLEVKSQIYDPGAITEYTGGSFGLNDATIGGAYEGTGNPSFTFVIDGVNAIKTSTLNAGGSGYAVNDTFTVDFGAVLATGIVNTVSSGAVTAYTITMPGSVYWVANAFTTTATSGAGTGLKINITAVADTFKWKKDSGSFTEHILITGALQSVSEGITISFGSTVGHGAVSGFTKNHIAGDTAPVDKTVTYGVVSSNLTGENKYWLMQNLGATHVGISATDSTEDSAGWYFQFNRKQGFKYTTTRIPATTWITSIDESANWTDAQNPCKLELGTDWRLPTSTEWQTADANGEVGGWDNYNETYASPLKLHAAGYLNLSTGVLRNRGSGGYYWSSTQYDGTSGRYLNFGSGGSGLGSGGKSYGFSVRCLSDTAPTADQWVASNFSATTYDPLVVKDKFDVVLFQLGDGSGASGKYIKDEDDMVSDSATAVPTQQSTKAYIDTAVGYYLPLAGGIMTGDITIDSDSKKVIFGAGQDMTIWYDGTDGQIKTDDIAASDLVISCGANKTIELTNPVYDDLRVTPGSFDRPGSSDPVIKQVTPGGSGTNTWLYEFAVNNIASFTVQMPHNYKTGEDIKVHIHWTPGDRGTEENTATVGWKIDYTWANINGTFGSMSTADLSDACNGVDWEHNMTPDVTIDGHTAAKGISSMLICNVKRTDTGTDDTWASTTSGQLPLLLEIDFHYPITRLGSRNWGTE